MTAEEIRNINPKYDNTDDFYLMCLDMFCIFREIAAQMAELNAALKPALTPTLTFDGNAEWKSPRGPLNLQKDHR